MARLTSSSRALAALASPVRQELVGVLGDAPATVRELAAALGRSRQALYHHLAVLEGAGIVRVTGWRGTGRSRERLYALTRARLAFGADRSSASARSHAVRAADAMLRLTGRELARAVRAASAPSSGPERGLLALRAKMRLDRAGLARLNARLDALLETSRSSPAPAPTARHYVLTLVLAPAEVSRAKDRAEGGR